MLSLCVLTHIPLYGEETEAVAGTLLCTLHWMLSSNR